MGCPFCEIISGVRPAHVVLDDAVAVAFLDARPVFKGHLLLAPRDHAETLLDLPEAQVGPLFTRAQWLARAMEDGLGAAGSFVAVNNRVSQSVPHLHIHVVPRRFKDGLRGFLWPRQRYEDEEAEARVAAAIRAALSGA